MNDLIKKAKKIFSVELVAFLYDSYVFLFHIALYIILMPENVPVFKFINMTSIIFYLFLLILFIFNKITIIYIGTIIEIVTFGMIGTIFLGKDLLFYTYSIAVMPIMIIYVYYSRCIMKKRKNKIYLYTILSFILFSSLFFSELLFIGNKPLCKISQTTKDCFFFANSLNIISAVIFGSVLFLILAISMHNKYEKIINENSYLATHDNLTGLSNRNALNNDLLMLKENNINFGVVICDIDDFKKFNDNYGHDYGDYVLRKIANIISGYSDKSLKVYRFGGEEIIFVYTEMNGIFDLIEKIRKDINGYNFSFNKQKTKVSMTFGISSLGEDFELLFKEADDKLYIGKEKGKNVVIY